MSGYAYLTFFLSFDSWVIRFTDLKGLRVISNSLSYLNKKPDSERKGQALELEYGLIKCIKVLVNARVSNKSYVFLMSFINGTHFLLLYVVGCT